MVRCNKTAVGQKHLWCFNCCMIDSGHIPHPPGSKKKGMITLGTSHDARWYSQLNHMKRADRRASQWRQLIGSVELRVHHVVIAARMFRRRPTVGSPRRRHKGRAHSSANVPAAWN